MADWDLIIAIPWVDLGLSASMYQTWIPLLASKEWKGKVENLVDRHPTNLLVVSCCLLHSSGTNRDWSWEEKSHQAREVKVIPWRRSLRLYQSFRRSMILPLHMQMVRIALNFHFTCSCLSGSWTVSNAERTEVANCLCQSRLQRRREKVKKKGHEREREREISLWTVALGKYSVITRDWTKIKTPAAIKSPE